MNRLILTSIISIILVGCSKTEDVGTAAEVASETAAAPAVHIPENPQVQADIDSIDAAVAAKDYDAALKKIAVLEQVPKSEKEQEEYRQTVKQVGDVLYQQSQTDPQALERYRQLARIRKGR